MKSKSINPYSIHLIRFSKFSSNTCRLSEVCSLFPQYIQYDSTGWIIPTRTQGFPRVSAVFNLAKEIWQNGEGDLPYEDEAMRAHAKSMVFPIGAPNDAFAQYFIGKSYLAPVSTSQVGIFNVTFEPGCRNNWHIHHAKNGGGQILVCVAGRGYYQEEGKEAIELKPGDCINIPAEVKHWHGAAPDSWFSHLAVEVPGEEGSNEWCEAVSDEEYGKLK